MLNITSFSLFCLQAMNGVIKTATVEEKMHYTCTQIVPFKNKSITKSTNNRKQIKNTDNFDSELTFPLITVA